MFSVECAWKAVWGFWLYGQGYFGKNLGEIRNETEMVNDVCNAHSKCFLIVEQFMVCV